MEWTQEHIDSIQHLLPTQRGNVVIDNLTFLRALHYIDKNGCCWQALPTHLLLSMFQLLTTAFQ